MSEKKTLAALKKAAQAQHADAFITDPDSKVAPDEETAKNNAGQNASVEPPSDQRREQEPSNRQKKSENIQAKKPEKGKKKEDKDNDDSKAMLALAAAATTAAAMAVALLGDFTGSREIPQPPTPKSPVPQPLPPSTPQSPRPVPPQQPEPESAPKSEPQPPKAHSPEESMPQSDTRQGRTSVHTAASCPMEVIPWFVPPGKDVVYGIHSDVAITPLLSGQKFFSTLAGTIAGATTSIDMITWGMDTDLLLTRAGMPNDLAHCDDSFRPFHDICPHTMKPCSAVDNRCPTNLKRRPIVGVTSLRFCDLLACAARRGVNVRLLVWEPVAFASNVIDPAHYWLRCKTGEIPNTKFMFRRYDGKFPDKVPFPEVLVKKDGELIEYAGGMFRAYEEKLNRQLARQKELYDFFYSHHQKMALIDVDKNGAFHSQKAKGFIMGFNSKEEYWDDSAHADYRTTRIPMERDGKTGKCLGPWRDAGVMLQGPILHDMARNMRESWNLCVGKEVVPANMVWDGMVEGQGKKLADPEKFPIKRYERIQEALREGGIPPIRAWHYDPYAWGVSACLFFTGIVDLVTLLSSGALAVDENLFREKQGWPGTPASPDELRLPPQKEGLAGAKRQCSQLLRTFTQAGAQRQDLSIFHACMRTIASVQHAGLIYMENQYFRDPVFAQALLNLYKPQQPVVHTSQGAESKTSDGLIEPRNPYIVVVTNRILNDEKVLSKPGMESALAAEPTHMVYRMLKEQGAQIHYCWLRVLDVHPSRYEAPRTSAAVNFLINAVTERYKGSVDLQPLAQKALELRNIIYTRVVQDGENSLLAAQFSNVLLWLHKTIVAPVDALFEPLEQYLNIAKNWLINRGVSYSLGVLAYEPIYDTLDKGIDHALAVMRSLSSKDAEQGKNALPPLSPDPIGDTIWANYAKLKKQHRTKWERSDGELDKRILQERREIGDLKRQSASLAARIDKPGKNFQEILDVPMVMLEHQGLQRQIRLAEHRLATLERMKKDEPSPAVPGAIYVHSKVMIVDEAAAMVGSNNLNQRSMWHDTEIAVLTRVTEKELFVADLRKGLFEIILAKGGLPRTWGGESVYEHFRDCTIKTDKQLKSYEPLSSHVVELISQPYYGGSVVLS